MDIAVFDMWRAAYDQMTYAEQQDFHDQMEAELGTQKGFNRRAYTRFLNYARQQLPTVHVLELGGWKGELACDMLNQFPDIKIWCNVEICRAAVDKSVFVSGKYTTWIPDDFVWHVDELPPANVVIASHFIEHVRGRELGALLERLPATAHYLGIQAPIEEDTMFHDWTGYHGSHILELGWQQVGGMLAALGYGEIGALYDKTGHGDFRAYVRH